MRTFSLGVAAAIASLALAAGSVNAADEKPKDARALKAEAEAARNREKGAKMAPDLVAGSKIYCTLGDARFVTTAKSELNGKSASTEFVEVTCKDNLGYVVGARKDGGFVAYDCVETSGKLADGKNNPLRCTLEGNAKPFRGLQAQLDATGVKCAIGGGRFVGFGPTMAVYELGCSRADGVMLTVATPRSATSTAKATSCYAVIKTDTPCTLTKPEQSAAFVNALAAKAPTPCAPTDSRLVAKSRQGDSFYEFGCANGTSYMVQADVKGEFVRAINCAQAQPLGGCTLAKGPEATAAR